MKYTNRYYYCYSLWATFLLCLFSFIEPHSYAVTPLTIAIDLDQTLVDDDVNTEIKPGDQVVEWQYKAGPNLIVSEKYRLIKGGAEFIESLRSIPHAKIAFFSLGSKQRNLFVLQALKLPDGSTSFLEAAEGRLLSREDVESDLPRPIANASLLRKDLNKLQPMIPGFQLDHAFLIDDQIRVPVQSQIKNLLWLKKQYYLKHGKIRPAVPTELHDPDRIIRARGIIAAAQQAAASLEISPVEALYQIQWITESAFLEFQKLMKPVVLNCSSGDLAGHYYDFTLEDNGVIFMLGQTALNKTKQNILPPAPASKLQPHRPALTIDLNAISRAQP